MDKIKRKVDEGKLVGTIFIDLSKAFDTLSHGKLLTKLESYGVKSVELEWFTDYLFNRSQQVQYKNSLSNEEKITCGVPQGSILGPLLFIVFFNDFLSCLKHSDVIKYADDTVIYVAGKDIFIIESRLSADMQAISNWCLQNELILNLKVGKTEAMLFGTSKNLSKQTDTLSVKYHYEYINFTTTYKYLGVEINPSLNMSKHFDTTFKKACGRLRLLNKIRPLLNQSAAKTIYQSMVLPTLTYCCILHLNQSRGQKSKLESFHKRVLNVIKCFEDVPNPYSISRIKACEFVRSCTDRSICSNFQSYFKLASHNMNTRNSGYLIELPKIRLEYARGSLYYMGAKIYNDLPLNIRKTENLQKYKTLLRKHF